MNKSSIILKRTPQRVELVKRMVDPNRAIAIEAQQAFAEFIAPAVQTVLDQKVTSNVIYRDLEYSKNDRPTIPLEYFVGYRENTIRVWSQQIAGGLPTNLIQGGGQYTFTVYRLDSAIAFYNDQLRNANLNLLSAGLDKMIQEIAIKQERNAWSPLIGALAGSNTNGVSHIIDSEIAGVFQLQDMNNLFTKIDRLYTSFIGGTPDSPTPKGLTDLFVSPEIIADIRAFAYQPMNTRGGFKTDGTEVGGVIALPDAVRQQIFSAGGLMSIYDVDIHKLIELGVGAKYNAVFDNFYQGSFNPATQEILMGFDLSQDVFLRPVIIDDDAGASGGNGQIQVLPDDQFFLRSEKTGFWAKLQEGRVILDSRALVGMIV